MEERNKTVWVIIILVLIAAIIYLLYGGGEDASRTARPGGEEQTPGKKIVIKSTPDKTYTPVTQDVGAIYGTGTGQVPPKNKLSHLQAVRELSNFAWDDNENYKSQLQPYEPMQESNFDQYMEKTVKPAIENSGFNMEMIGQINKAENNPQYLQAVDLYQKGKYKEAVEIFAMLAEKSNNIYLKSVALGYLLEIYKKTGDEQQAKAAQGALMVTNAKLYFKSFPGSEKTFTTFNKEAEPVIKKLISEQPKMSFKPPKKSFE